LFCGGAIAGTFKNISVDGLFGDWAGVPLLDSDPADNSTTVDYGDIYVAHSLALATRKNFDQIISFKKSGLSWSQIAQMHNCSLKGSTAALRQMLKEG